MAAKPQRDRLLHRQRVDPRIGYGMPLALEGDERLCPEQPHRFDLFLDPLAPRRRVDADRLHLAVLPSDADAEAQPASTQQVDFRSLLGGKCGGTQCQQRHTGVQLNPFRDRREEREQRERLVPRLVEGQPGWERLRARRDDVFREPDVRVAEAFGRLYVVADLDRVCEVREVDADAHRGDSTATRRMVDR